MRKKKKENNNESSTIKWGRERSINVERNSEQKERIPFAVRVKSEGACANCQEFHKG